jgi:exo-beta-1,3-glucanase (GH17 family)
MNYFVSAFLLFAIALTTSDCLSQDTSKKLGGVCFSAVRDNESPARQIHSLPSAIEEDVEFASKLAGAIRTYTISSSSYLIPEFCEKYGVDCIVGVWIGPYRWQNDAQLEQLAKLTSQKNPRIKAVIIGNEVLHRGDCSESQLLEYIRTAKKTTNVPVAVADTWRAWIEHPQMAAEVDICGVQIYPFWEGHAIDGAAEYTLQRVREVQAKYPDKRIVLTEFGWPTGGESLGQAEASLENSARYVREVIPLLEQNKIEYYYFSIWDERWKLGPEGAVGAHWGLYESSGVLKPEFQNLVPNAVASGSKRSARSIEFALKADEARNAPLIELAVGLQDIADARDAKEQRGVGLEVKVERVGRSSYEQLRPMQTASQKVEAPTDSKTEAADRENPTAPVPAKEKTNPDSIAVPAKDQPKRPMRELATESPLGPNDMFGVCLSLFRDEETPHLGITPLISELRADVKFAATFAHAVRTYSVTDSFAFVPDLCQEIGVDCFPGAALGKYPWLNDLELEMLIRVGQSPNSRVQAVLVGNEVLHRGDFSIQQYIQYIRQVKKKVTVPVATAELLHSWLEHPELAAEVDILGVQIYPYWGGLTIERAAANTLESVQQLQSKFPGKRVILTEFGWPTDGGTLGDAVANAENAARYLKEVVPLLNQNKIEYMYFAMTDEKWKQRDEGGPGPHWGLLSSDGQVKPSFRVTFPAGAKEGMVRPARKLNFGD